MTAGSLVFDILDHEVRITMIGGGQWSLPVGPATLVDNELERAPRPAPEQLTNALGIVTDHLDDVIRESSLIASAPSVGFAGDHATVLAQVELGETDLPDDYRLERVDADEVFRTLVAEPRSERLHNPGLPADHVDTVVATCCVVLAIMRRLELSTATVATSSDAH